MLKIPDCLNCFSFQSKRDVPENTKTPLPSENSIAARVQKLYNWFKERPERFLPAIVLGSVVGGICIGKTVAPLYYDHQIETLNEKISILYDQEGNLLAQGQTLDNIRYYLAFAPLGVVFSIVAVIGSVIIKS